MCPNVVVNSASRVLPSVKIAQPFHHYITNYGMLHGDIRTTMVCYFKPSREIDGLCSLLKDSLAQVLSDNCVVAGRAEVGEDGRYHVNCNNQGVPFVEASTDTRFNDLSDIRNCGIQDKLSASSEPGIEVEQGLPVMIIQLTLFACGGFSIGFSSLEMVLDGYCATAFIKGWSELTRGLPNTTSPVFEGEFLRPRECPTLVHRGIVERNLVVADSTTELLSASPYQQVKLGMSEDRVNALVREVEEGPFNYGHPTAFEALSALVWQAMTRARSLPDERVTHFTYQVSCRGNQRWDPPVPLNYLGNTVHFSALPAKAGDIKSKHLSYVARLIHEDIANVTPEVCTSTIDWMELQFRKGSKVRFNVDYYGGAVVNCTSLYTFPVYEADFGHGKPLHCAIPSYLDGDAFIFPTREGGRSKELFISLLPAHINKLLADDEFMSYFTLLCLVSKNKN